MTQKAENPITQELVKSNVTDAVIASLRTKYLPLKINGIEDKEGYDTVHKARIECRDIRILAEKVCKKGREEAVRIQKEWLAKEKEVVAKVQEVELYLKKQEDDIDAQKEAIKIRQERLLKLPGRKEQMKGLEEFIANPDVLTDENIMDNDDSQWNQIIVLAQGMKLAKQQKEIDDRNAQELLARTIKRENELIETGARVHFSAGCKIYRKGSASIVEQSLKEYDDEKWVAVVATFKLAPDEAKPTPVYAVPMKEQPSPAISEMSDEEKLFHYASALERVECGKLRTEGGQKVYTEAQAKLNEALTILRK